MKLSLDHMWVKRCDRVNVLILFLETESKYCLDVINDHLSLTLNTQNTTTLLLPPTFFSNIFSVITDTGPHNFLEFINDLAVLSPPPCIIILFSLLYYIFCGLIRVMVRMCLGC